MRLALLALYAFCELLESVSCAFSMGAESPNPTLTAKHFRINHLTWFCDSFFRAVTSFPERNILKMKSDASVGGLSTLTP